MPINLLKFNWKTGLILILLFSVPRFILVMSASVTGNYQWVSLIFVAMMITPLILLNKEGRRRIGLIPIQRWNEIYVPILGGIFAVVLMTTFAVILYGLTRDNWFVHISSSYTQLPSPLGEERLKWFLIFSAMSMIFSPLGEEIFYRGWVHECFVPSLGEERASMVDSVAFSLVHLAHFGLFLTPLGWEFHVGPALFWVIFLFLTCMMFSYSRRATGSVFGAVLAHMMFNLGMNVFIFYGVLV